MTLNADRLLSDIQAQATPEALAWLSDQQAKIRQPDAKPYVLEMALASARRQMSDAPLADPALGHWTLADAARVLLLLDALAQADPAALLPQAYAQGDEYEREAILKGLALLDPEGHMHPLAVDACRTNVLTMLSAIALKNPYPARHFQDGELNQMVLKCLFLGLDIALVQDLARRLNPSLSRMCFDYFRERRAAGRTIPTSIWFAIRVTDLPEAGAAFGDYLTDDDAQHRRNVILAVRQQADACHGSELPPELAALRARIGDDGQSA